MFFHNFKYSLKTLFRSRALIFWTYAFPIILGTFFFLAFSNIESGEKLDIIHIAIVETNDFSNNKALKETFDKLGSSQNEEQMFSIEYTTEENAKNMLNDNKIEGYLLFENNLPKVVVKQNGINATVFKYVVEEIMQTQEIINNTANIEIAQQLQNGNYNINYEEIYSNILKNIDIKEDNIKDISSNNLSYTMIEFYTLIAMTCLYGGILGMVAINNNLANMSSKGKRVAVSSISKWKLIASSVLASYIVQIIGIVILFAYTIGVLHVDYGSNTLLVAILALIGSFAGLSFGIAVGTFFKTNDNIKTGIIISITMLWSFLSGMMGITMKYIVDKNIPILNKLNPANMITDGLYSLYYYDTMERYYFNIISLVVFAFFMIAISYISLRRQKYDSI